MRRAACLAGAVLLAAGSARAADGGADAGDPGAFAYDPPGQLVAGSGQGRADDVVYAPNIRFPIERGPAFANSQVWGVGGNSGPAGSQCDKRNFSYPWRDNYCETRDYDMPLCPAGKGHQGQDVRAADCEKGVHTTVAVVDGTITNVGSYSVYLTDANGVRYDYLHMSDLVVKVGDKVKRGDPMGKVANVFGTSSTTVHLHFNIHQNVQGVGLVYVPPYTSLIQAYQTLMYPSPDGGPPPPISPPAPPAEAPSDAGAAPPAPGQESGCSCVAGPHGVGAGDALLLVGLGAAAVLFSARRRSR